MAQPIREQAEDVDSLSSLEERINRAVELVMTLREENAALAHKLAETTAETAQAVKQAQQAIKELDDLRSERKQVRTRIEKLLGQMDLLSNA